MNVDRIRARCLALPGATEDIKWDDNLVFSVCAKMFALVNLEPPNRVWFKCDDETFGELTARDGIIPAPYLARAKWVCLETIDAMESQELSEYLEQAYEIVKAKLPRKQQAELAATKVPRRAGRPMPSAR
jgi:predicted DNA-binding protein (MmcQ/YjbR family)